MQKVNMDIFHQRPFPFKAKQVDAFIFHHTPFSFRYARLTYNMTK